MNAESQLIGSLLCSPKDIENDEFNKISAEMFTNPLYGDIYNYILTNEGEINSLALAKHIKSDVLTENQALELLGNLVSERDFGVSDSYCINEIYNNFRARKLEEFINKTKATPDNIDKILEEVRTEIDGLQKDDEKSDIQTLSELTELKDAYFKDKKKESYNLGFKQLDDAIGGIDKGDTIIIAARPGVGKSAYSLQIIRKFGRDGIKTGYFNLEMSKKQIYERAAASASGIELNRIRRGLKFLNNEEEMFRQGNEKLKQETNVYVISGTQTIRNIRAIQKKYSFQVIVIDYLQLITPESKRNGNRAAEVGDISRGLKAIARDFNIPVIALSQLNRASEINKDKEPTMSELRESGDIEQDASVILMLWNPNKDDLSEKMIKVEKSRNGYTDRLKLYFDGKHMTFSIFDVLGNPRIEPTDEDDLPWS